MGISTELELTNKEHPNLRFNPGSKNQTKKTSCKWSISGASNKIWQLSHMCNINGYSVSPPTLENIKQDYKNQINQLHKMAIDNTIVLPNPLSKCNAEALKAWIDPSKHLM